MDGSDRRLELIGTDSSQANRPIHQPKTLRDLVVIPARTILFFQSHQLTAAVYAGVSARVLQQHQSQQAQVLRFVPHQLAEYAAQADSFGTEILPDEILSGGCGVAFIEDQVDDRLNR